MLALKKDIDNILVVWKNIITIKSIEGHYQLGGNLRQEVCEFTLIYIYIYIVDNISRDFCQEIIRKSY